MTEALRTNHNELVKPNDHYINLGDLTMERGEYGSPQAEAFIEEMKKWNGKKWLIPGNHDHFPPEVYIKAGFTKITGSARWFKNFILSHYPVHPMSLDRDGCVHGHTHNVMVPHHTYEFNNHPAIKPYINISVECTNYKPVNLDYVQWLIDKTRREYLENIQAS